jgi:ligand-binding sensor domain-containing protein
LACDLLQANVSYAGTGSHGLYRRLDCALPWQQLPRFTDRSVYALLATGNGRVYAAIYGDGIFASTDQGNTWQEASNGLANRYVYALTSHPSDPEKLYAASDRVYKSTDAGGAWIPTGNGLTSTEINCLTIVTDAPQVILAGTSDKGIFRSTNGGDSWQQSNSGLSSMVVWSLAVSHTDSRVLFAGTNGGVFRSDDRGASWTYAGLGKTYCLTAHPDTRRTIYAGTDGSGVFISKDDGLSWTPFNDGLGDSVVQALVVTTNGCRQLYAGSDKGIWECPVN